MCVCLCLYQVIDKNQEWQKYREKVDVKLSETKKHIQELGQEKRTALDQVTKLQVRVIAVKNSPVTLPFPTAISN